MAVEITRNFVGGKNKTTKIKKPKFKQNKKRGQTQTTSTAPPVAGALAGRGAQDKI